VLFFNHISGKSLLQCTQVYILKSVKKIFSQAKVSYRHGQPKRGGQSVRFDGKGPFGVEPVSCEG
jgi:hypothetical protein